MAAILSIPWQHLPHFFRHWNEAYQWPLYFVLGWVAIYVRRWRKRRDEDAAQGWPSADGRIIGGKVTRLAHTSQFLATLEYSYILEDKHRYGKYTHEFPKKPEAEEFVRTMKDKQVQIRYKPSNPDKSVLEQRVIEQFILLTPRFG
jgi:hypothetical protein